jgi:hypothetical protein
VGLERLREEAGLFCNVNARRYRIKKIIKKKLLEDNMHA